MRSICLIRREVTVTAAVLLEMAMLQLELAAETDRRLRILQMRMASVNIPDGSDEELPFH